MAFSFKGSYGELYHLLRNQSPLPSRLVCEVIRERRWHKKAKFFKGNSLHYHKTSYRLFPDKISLVTISGRITIPFKTGEYQRRHMIGWKFREGKLVYRKRTFYFNLVIQKEVEERRVDKFIGVDSGIENFAVLSNGLIFKGEEIKVREFTL